MTSSKHQKHISPLAGLSLLLGVLLGGCSEDLKVTTKQGLPCTERPNSRYCKDREQKEVKSLSTLKIEDVTVSTDSTVSISTTITDEANSGNQIFARLSTDRECRSELQIAATEKSIGVRTFQNVPEGVYYACVTGTTTVGTKVAAANDGKRIVVDYTKPNILASPEIIANSNGDLAGDLKIIDVSNVSLKWNLVNDSSGAWLEADDTMMPRLGGAINGTYTAILTATDEVGNTSSQTFKITKNNTPVSEPNKLTAPSAISVDAYVNTTSVIVSYSSGSGTDFSTHHVKACTASNCSTGCLSTTQDAASPVTVSGLAAGSSYYICMQTVDLAANTSAYVASGNSVTVDTTAPAAPSAIVWAGSYSNSTTASLTWTNGSDTNFSTHNLKACTDSGCGASCTSVTQDAATPGFISGMTAGSSYYACLQTVDLAGNTSAYVASAGTTLIDTTIPVAPSAVTVATYSTATSVNVTYTAGTDTNFSTHNVKACTASDCMTGCLGVTQDPVSPVTVSSLVNGSAYYICMQTVDLAANTSAYVASGNSVTVDTTTPAAPAAIAWAGAYSSSTTASLSWTNGSDTNFSTHNLKACTDSGCGASCTSVTQDAATPGSIANMVAGTAYYACLQAVDLAGNTSAFVASAATVMIDTTVPLDPTAVSVPGASNGNVAISFTAGAETNPSSFNIKACTAGCTVGCVGATTTAASPGTISGAALTNGNSYRGCVQGTDLAGNSSSWVQSSGLVIFDSSAPNGASNITVPAYSNSTSVAASFTVGADANMSTHNFKACTSNDCSTGCLTAIQTATSPATLTSLVNGTAYYACGQAVDLAGNTSSFSFTPATVIIDTTAPTAPASVSVPGSTNGSFNITFTVGTDTNFSTHNVKACTSNNCSTGCVGSGTSAGSPASISGAALTASTSYYGCVQSLDLATNTSAFVASSSTVTYSPYTVTYNGNGNTSGSVPTDSNTYPSGSTVTVLGDTGSLTRTPQTFSGWNTAADGSGTTYTAAQTFAISANTTLYAVWSMCTGMAGGTWITVPGNSIYGTSDFCVQKYAPSNVSSVPTSQAGTTPWVNISQTSAITTCASLGTGFHLITNPEWMTLAANLANVGSNWSGAAVGTGYLRRGHSDSNPNNACAADASDANAYVETTCTGSSTVSGTFTQRRTSMLSNGAVVWDIGGNVYNWVNYFNSADKPTPANNAWYEYTAITGSTTTPKSHLVPLNSAQSWWTDSWTSAQGIGQYYSSGNSLGGGLLRGGSRTDGANAGAFSVLLNQAASTAFSFIGFRCAYQPAVTVTYNSNGATSGSVPTDSTAYSSGQGVTILGNTGSLAKTNYTFVSWNTAANGSGTTYTAAQVMTMPAASTTLYAQWSHACSGLAGGTWIKVPSNSIYGTSDFCVQKYIPSDVSSVATSQTGTTPWVNISQTTAISECAELGTGYHLITNPEWMTIGANMAQVASNWSGGAVGNGHLRRGHSDNNPTSACAANANDADAYVETNCTGSSSGTFVQRRTATLSNGNVIWDFGGNLWQIVNAYDPTDKPGYKNDGFNEYSTMGAGTTSWPRSTFLPQNSAQSWWADTWNSTQGIGQMYPGPDGQGGALLRGATWESVQFAGPFAAYMAAFSAAPQAGFRCAWQP